jgi:hypothetical protein
MTIGHWTTTNRRTHDSVAIDRLAISFHCCSSSDRRPLPASAAPPAPHRGEAGCLKDGTRREVGTWRRPRSPSPSPAPARVPDPLRRRPVPDLPGRVERPRRPAVVRRAGVAVAGRLWRGRLILGARLPVITLALSTTTRAEIPVPRIVGGAIAVRATLDGWIGRVRYRAAVRRPSEAHDGPGERDRLGGGNMKRLVEENS